MKRRKPFAPPWTPDGRALGSEHGGARGTAYPIKKRLSHIIVAVAEQGETEGES